MLSSITNSPLLETLLCLVLVYALLSLLVSTLTEIINSYFNERGELLYKTISRLFNDGFNPNFGQLMYSHPMITALRKNINNLPQYISNKMFSQVLTDVVGNFGREYAFSDIYKKIMLASGTTDPFERFQQGVSNMGQTDLKLVLLNMVEKSISLSGNDPSKRLEILDAQIQQWYSDQMDRTSGWFKDMMGSRIRWSSLVVALLLNVNSIEVFKSLYSSPQLRAEIVPVAEQLADNYKKQLTDTSLSEYQKELRAVSLTEFKQAKDDSAFRKLDTLLAKIQKLDSIRHIRDSARLVAFKNTNDVLNDLSGLGIPIGWRCSIPPFKRGESYQLFWWIIGITITTFAISFGAPFWFDLLLKLVNIRKAGKKPDN
jgi:hypothetical protein